jgi:hypothetical protein
MKKGVISIIVLAAFFTLPLAGCIPMRVWSPLIGCSPMVGSGNVVTTEMDFSDFTRIEVGSGFEADITQSDSYFVSVTVDEDLLPSHLDISQRGDTLTIRIQPFSSFLPTTKKATITLPKLEGLSLSGASKGNVRGFSSIKPLELNASGASFLDVETVEAGDTKFDISGASNLSGTIKTGNSEFEVSGASSVELKGSATNAVIVASGASTLRLTTFPVTKAEVELSGGSRATVTANGRLDADLSGASVLNYTGSPTLGDITVSAGSTLNQR